jgi:putative tricarboxylic transport membrane protein
MRGDLVSGAALTGLGLYIIAAARGWDYSSPDGPGPGMFPLWYGIAMVVLALGLMASSLLAGKQRAETTSVNWRETGNALLAWTALALCIGLLKVLGFVLAFALLTLFIVAGVYRRPLRSALLVAGGSSLGFYLVFPLALNVPLPVGLLGF